MKDSPVGAREHLRFALLWKISCANLIPYVERRSTENIFLTRRKHFSIEKRHLTLCVYAARNNCIYLYMHYWNFTLANLWCTIFIASSAGGTIFHCFIFALLFIADANKINVRSHIEKAVIYRSDYNIALAFFNFLQISKHKKVKYWW